MSAPNTHGLAAPDPRRIATRREFGAELTLARLRRNLSVRHVARRVSVPASTLGGYFAGATGAVSPTLGQVLVSTQAPIERLLIEPTLRGRDDLARRLDDVVARGFHLHTMPRVHVLQGLAGCGKSMLALAVASRAKARGITTFWVTADDRPTTVAGLRALSIQIGVSVDRLTSGSLPDALWQRLQELNEPWLLVLDNADDPPRCLALPGRRVTDGTGFLRAPGPGLGTVLVTTRDGATSTWGDPPPAWLLLHRLTGLDRDDGAKVLAELAGEPAGGTADAAELSDRLGGLPLALMLTGRYLAESRKIPGGLSATAGPGTYRDYLTAMDRGGYAHLFAGQTGDSRSAMGPNWSLSLDLLEARGLRAARPILHTLACLSATAVPYGDVLRAEVLAMSPLFPGITARTIWDVLRGLESVGLITFGKADGGLLDMHPLVRDTARSDPPLREVVADLLTTVTALLGAAVHNAQPKSPPAWQRWRLLAGHCTAPLGLLDLMDTPSPEQPRARALARAAVELAGRAGEYLRASGLHDQAEDTLIRAIGACDGRLPTEDPVRLRLEHELARLRYGQGRYDEAERIYRSVLAARHHSLGEEHADTLATQYYLARTLRDRECLDEAEDLLRLTYEARHRLLGEGHPDTLTSRHGLADLLRVRGANADAAGRYAEVLAARRVVLGERHPATLVTRQYLAELLHQLGESNRAEQELRWLWAANQEIRGPEHPRTLAVGHSLVDLLHDRGYLDEAALAGAVLAARQRLLGHTHPATLNIRHRLGLIRLDQGQLSAAHRDLAAVLVDRGLVLGRDHPQTRLSGQTVDAVQRRMGMSVPRSDAPTTLAPDPSEGR